MSLLKGGVQVKFSTACWRKVGRVSSTNDTWKSVAASGSVTTCAFITQTTHANPKIWSRTAISFAEDPCKVYNFCLYRALRGIKFVKQPWVSIRTWTDVCKLAAMILQRGFSCDVILQALRDHRLAICCIIVQGNVAGARAGGAKTSLKTYVLDVAAMGNSWQCVDIATVCPRLKPLLKAM